MLFYYNPSIAIYILKFYTGFVLNAYFSWMHTCLNVQNNLFFYIFYMVVAAVTNTLFSPSFWKTQSALIGRMDQCDWSTASSVFRKSHSPYHNRIRSRVKKKLHLLDMVTTRAGWYDKKYDHNIFSHIDWLILIFITIYNLVLAFSSNLSKKCSSKKCFSM